MTLLELQRQMSEDVRRPLAKGFAMQQVRDDGRSLSDVAESYVKPNDRLSSFERLEIYNRQYWFRVIGAVSEDFPALRAVLGSKRFDALLLAYLKENPSTSFTLRDLGSCMPMWLMDHPEFSPDRKRQLALDVARLEWAYVEAYDRATLPPLMAEDFGSLDEDSTLSLQPHLQLLALRYPVDELVLALREQTPKSDIMSNAVTEMPTQSRPKLPSMRRAAVYLAIHRYQNTVYYRRIEREAYLLLKALQANQPLGKSLEEAFSDNRFSSAEQPAKIQQYFAHAAEMGWFCQHPAKSNL